MYTRAYLNIEAWFYEALSIELGYLSDALLNIIRLMFIFVLNV